MTDTVNPPKGAIIVHDQDGKEYILIPRDQSVPLTQPEKSQIERINEILDSWEPEPGDTQWWEEFREFLRDNPIMFNEPPSQLMDDE